MTGAEAISRVGNRIIEYRATAGEDTRILEHLNATREEIEVEIETVEPDWLLTYKDFTTGTSEPNVYSIRSVAGVTSDIEAEDYNKLRYLERVIDASTNQFERIRRLHSINEKEGMFRVGEENIDLALDGSTGSGAPQGYMLRDNEIMLWPLGDQAYTVRLWYVKHYADIADDSDVIDFPRALNEALVWGAVMKERFFRRDKTDDALMMFDRALARGLVAIVDQAVDDADQIAFVGDDGI